MARTLGAVLIVALTAACGGGRSRAAAPFVTSFDKHLDQMTLHELWEASEKVGWVHGPYQPRSCALGDCEARFDAVAGQVPGPANVSTRGTIVARVVNAGKGGDRGEESRYKAKLRGGKRHYLVIAQSDGAGGWSWSVREARKNSGDRSTPLTSGSWTECARNTNNPNHPQGQSQFASCPHPGPSPMSRSMVTDPGWLHCTSGCCTAGPVTLHGEAGGSSSQR